jgi:hypothetical protein
MYSSEESEQDTTDLHAPASVAVKPKSAPAAFLAAEARELTPAEKLKRRMMLALAKTRQRDMQTSNLKAAAVEEEQRKTNAVRERMREVEASQVSASRFAYHHHLTHGTHRRIFVSSNATSDEAMNAEAEAGRVLRMIGVCPEMRTGMAIGTETIWFMNRLMLKLILKQPLWVLRQGLIADLGTSTSPPIIQLSTYFVSHISFCSRSRSRSREREVSYSRTRDRSWDRDREKDRERHRAHDRGKDSHQDRHWRRDR